MPQDKPRLLVTAFSYGSKQVELLRRLIRNYQAMRSLEIDIVVFSDALKDLGPGIRVVVGVPTDNPRSLGFANRKYLAEQVDRYDLFIHTEEDIGVAEEQIHKYVEATAALEPREIAGFLRYEVDSGGRRVLTDVFGVFHWRPESVRRRGAYTIAEYTNPVSAFYILTSAQLKRALEAGYLREPYEGRYGMLETAATGPDESCGFTKVICVSHLADFLVHHMSDKYAEHSPPLASFERQVQALQEIASGARQACSLGVCEPSMPLWRWTKSYYETPIPEVLELIPNGARTVLSVGCGSGEPEAALMARGTAVTAVTLDSVIAAEAAARGIETVEGAAQTALGKLRSRTFDAVFISNMLHLQREPWRWLRPWLSFVAPGGSLVLTGPNFDFLTWRLKKLLGFGGFGQLRRFEEGGIAPCGPRDLAAPLRGEGLSVSRVRWLLHAVDRRFFHGLARESRPLARSWALQAGRPKP